MAEPIVIHAATCNGDTYEIRYYRASDYDALAAENALLREERDRAVNQVAAYAAENAALREQIANWKYSAKYDDVHVAALRRDAEYYKWRLTEIIPLFQEARDALTAIPLANAKLRGLDLTLADRMDVAGTRTIADFDAAMGEKP